MLDKLQCDLLADMSKDDIDKLLLLASEQYKLDKSIIMEKLLKFEISVADVKDFNVCDERFTMLLFVNPILKHRCTYEISKRYNNPNTQKPIVYYSVLGRKK